MGLWKKKNRKKIKALSLTMKIPTPEPPLSLPAKMSLAPYPQVNSVEMKGDWGEVRAKTKRESGESESESIAKREKKTNKILNGHLIVTVHICTVTVAIVHKCTILHSLMWVFFYSNCVKLATFFILHNYTSTDVIALKWKEEVWNLAHSLKL